MANTSRDWEDLESRRLLSADVPADVSAPARTEPDLPVIEYTSDVVVAAGRQQVYPPLAPAMWVDESVGSFEEPEVITVAFFPPDPVEDAPVEDAPVEGEAVAPPVANAPDVASHTAARLNPIAREVLGTADDDATSLD